MGVFQINVQILSGSNVGGVYPFVVVCFDNDLPNEVYKSAATNGGPTCTWNESFPLDLTTHVKNIVSDGKPEPTYLTFFVFDTGTPGVPSLGSAGVLLSTVRDAGIAKGDFPVVNGTGTLSLIVESEKYKKWYQTDAAKIAGVAGAVGVGALAAGLTAMAFNNKKKKKKASASGSMDEGKPGEGEKKKNKFLTGLRSITGGDSSSSESENSHEAPHGNGNASRSFEAGRASAPSSSRPWWDPETDEEDEETPINTADARGHQVSAPMPFQYPQGAPSYEPGLGGEPPASVHIHYHDGSAGQPSYPSPGEVEDDNSAFQHHVHLHEGQGEYGGTYVEENGPGKPRFEDERNSH